MPSGVHDSALIVNAYRARKALVSADRFADLWISEEIEKWANQYAEKVGPTEVLVHALRHRFFLERLTNFHETVHDGVFVNIGAGFTNYPYLLQSGIPCCEVDTELNIDFKEKRLAEFEFNGDIPKRTIKFIAVNDLNDLAQVANLQLELREWIGNRASFVLFEGVFFYLKIETISYFYSMLASIQKTGGIVASTSFRPEESNKEMFHRLVDYCQSDYKMKEFIPTTVPTEFYDRQQGYALTSHENYYALCKRYASHKQLDNPKDVLEEDCYILEKL